MNSARLAFLIALSTLTIQLDVRAQNRNTTRGTNAGLSLTVSAYDNIYFGFDAGRTLEFEDRNSIIGSQAGISLLDTSLSEFLGAGATVENEFRGQDNVIIGYRAAWQTSGLRNRNVIIGYEAGIENRASYAVFLGYQAGFSNAGGFRNTFLGEKTGLNNTTGDNNTFVGNLVGGGITTGFSNTAAGRLALSQTPPNEAAGNSYNTTAIGVSAGAEIGTQETWNNTFIGAFSGALTTGGLANTFIGSAAGNRNRLGSYNTFIGVAAGWDNNRLADTEYGYRNTYLGTAAGSRSRRGTDNVCVGSLADFGSWDAASASTIDQIMSSETGNIGNVAQGNISNIGGATGVLRAVTLGSFAGTLQDDCVTLGYSADGNAPRAIALGSGAQATHADAIAIGYQATTHSANTLVLGNATTTSLDPGADGVTALGSPSYRYASVNTASLVALADTDTAATIDLNADAGSSNNDQWRITAADSGDLSITSFATGSYVQGLTLDNTGNLTVSGEVAFNSDARLKTNIRPIRQALKNIQRLDGKQYEWKPETGRKPGRHFGFIAQDVQRVYPHLVTKGSDDFLSVRYSALIPVLINAINEQQDMLDEDDARIAALETKDDQSLRQDLEELKASIGRHLGAESTPTPNAVAFHR